MKIYISPTRRSDVFTERDESVVAHALTEPHFFFEVSRVQALINAELYKTRGASITCDSQFPGDIVEALIPFYLAAGWNITKKTRLEQSKHGITWVFE